MRIREVGRQLGDAVVGPTQRVDKNCSSEWTTVNGINGWIFTGSNGGSIFLPAAGIRFYGGLYNTRAKGDIWSSAPDPSIPNLAYSLNFNSGGFGRDRYERAFGRSVRPVSE